MASTINATPTSSGLISSADASGVLELQSGGVTKATISSSGLAIGQYNPTSSLVSSGTNAATTSGTNVTFTSIPSWVKRITMMLNGVAVNGATVPAILIQIGSGSLTTSGYSSAGCTLAGGVSGTASTSGFVYRGSGAASTYNGIITVQNITGNTWVCTAIGSNPAATQEFVGSGFVTLSGVLDRIALVTTDALNGGSINISFE